MSSPKIQRRQSAVLCSALVLAQTLFLAPAFAKSEAVRIAGQTVFVIQTASQTDKRAATIQKQLDNALVAASDTSPQSVKIVYVKGLPVITVGGYQVITITSEDAKAQATTPALLASRFAAGIKKELADTHSTQSYIAQLSGDTQSPAPSEHQAYKQGSAETQGYAPQPHYAPPRNYTASQNNAPQQNYAPPQQNYAPQQNSAPPQNAAAYQGGRQPYGGGYAGQYGEPVRRGHVVALQSGLTIPATLSTAISTQVAKPGDMIQAQISQSVVLGEGEAIPAGSILIGQIVDAKGGGFFGKSGSLSFNFNRIRTPDGSETPITTHLVGKIGKYADGANNSIQGETMGNKVASAGIRGLIGAGSGAALGTALGAIAGRSGRATGRGAWGGTAIGGGLGVADSLLLRKGKNVDIPSGQALQVQLDAPATISGNALAGQQYGNL